jgi:predicted RNA binding protein YcfA (HicA-like mRNA interferase family)
MTSKKDIEQLKRKAEKQGWTVEVTNGGHRRWTSPQGEKVFSALTPSDHRAIKNIIKELARRGYTPQGYKK